MASSNTSANDTRPRRRIVLAFPQPPLPPGSGMTTAQRPAGGGAAITSSSGIAGVGKQGQQQAAGREVVGSQEAKRAPLRPLDGNVAVAGKSSTINHQRVLTLKPWDKPWGQPHRLSSFSFDRLVPPVAVVGGSSQQEEGEVGGPEGQAGRGGRKRPLSPAGRVRGQGSGEGEDEEQDEDSPDSDGPLSLAPADGKRQRWGASGQTELLLSSIEEGSQEEEEGEGDEDVVVRREGTLDTPPGTNEDEAVVGFLEEDDDDDDIRGEEPPQEDVMVWRRRRRSNRLWGSVDAAEEEEEEAN